MIDARRLIWTPEMDAVLTDAAAKGLGDRQVYDLIGVDRHQCRLRRKALGIPPGKTGRPRLSDRNARLLELAGAIGSIRACAERLGMTYDAAAAAIRRERNRRAAMHGGSDAS